METTLLDLTGKTITAYILHEAIQALEDKAVGESVLLMTDDFKAIENDLSAWGRMTGWPVSFENRESSQYLIRITKAAPVNRDRKLALIISENGLEELLSPLGMAICCGLSGYEVHLYFQGPAVKVLKKGYKEKLRGLNAPFSVFARKGLNKVGHVPAQQKLETLHKLGARFYICQPSMQHFGVKEKDLIFQDHILCEYLTFLEVFGSSDLKFFLQ